MNFKHEFGNIISKISHQGTAVLSTSLNNKVTSRTISLVTYDNVLAFQTSMNMRKYIQIQGNANVALCLGEIQLEGIAVDKGKAKEHEKFTSLFKEKHRGSYDAYTHLDSERIVEISPTYIQVWKYIDGKPHVFKLDMVNEMVSLTPYYHEVGY